MYVSPNLKYSCKICFQISNQRLYSIRFLKQFVLLATHVSFVNHHWEKVLALSEKFLSVIE